MDREQARKRIAEIEERFRDHVALAGDTTGMLQDMRFALDVAQEHLAEPTPVQMAVPVTTVVEEPLIATTADGTQGMQRGVTLQPNGDTPGPKATKPKRRGTKAQQESRGWA